MNGDANDDDTLDNDRGGTMRSKVLLIVTFLSCSAFAVSFQPLVPHPVRHGQRPTSKCRLRRHRRQFAVLHEENSTLSVLQPINDESSETDDTPELCQPHLINTTEPFWPSSILLLNLVAVLWGTQHSVIKMIVGDEASGADAFTLLRFGLAALLASPYTPKLGNRQAWRWGAEMGLWMFLGFSFQAIGLESTTAQKSGFLLYLNVKFVPFLARVFLGREISIPTWLSALTAFTGTALLAYDSNGGGLALNTGDWWSIAAALSSAMFILRLERASADVSDAASLNAACLWIVTALAGIWTLLQQRQPVGEELVHIVTDHGWQLLYLSGVTTALANWIQTKAQRDVPAERASIVYAMDPVYGAGFAYVLLGETLSGRVGWTGAAMITLAAATNALTDLPSSTSYNGGDSKHES